MKKSKYINKALIIIWIILSLYLLYTGIECYAYDVPENRDEIIIFYVLLIIISFPIGFFFFLIYTIILTSCSALITVLIKNPIIVNQIRDILLNCFMGHGLPMLYSNIFIWVMITILGYIQWTRLLPKLWQDSTVSGCAK